MADSLYAQPSQPIEMKVFQGGGLADGQEAGGGASLLPTPTTAIEMKVFQGGGQAERQSFENGLVEYKKTKYFRRIQAASRKPNAAIYFIDTEGRVAVCKRRDPGDRVKDGKIMAAGGAVDPSDKQEFPANPSILAALREGNEEIGINPFGIQDFTKLTQAEKQSLTAAVNEFIPLWNTGKVEAYIYLLKKAVPANGPDPTHAGELYTNYDFKEFGANPAQISKQKQGVAYVDIQHLIQTVVGNPRLEFTYYTKFFRILGAIQKNSDDTSMDKEIHQIITGIVAAPVVAPKKPIPTKPNPSPLPNIPPLPKGRYIFQKGKPMRRMRNNENNWGNTVSEKQPTPATTKLSSGYTVRVVDDSLKDTIQTLQFTEDEKQIFENELHFTHPFIREWLQKEENREKWYEFWKTYVNFNGSDKFHLMTYEEGQKIQRFKKEVYDAYRQYLLSAALPFLLKTTSPKGLKEYFNPPEAKKGFLFETVQHPPSIVPEGEAATVEVSEKGSISHLKKAGKPPVVENMNSVDSWNSEETNTNSNAGTSYSGDSETTAGTSSSTNTTESDESTETNGETIQDFDILSIRALLFEPVSNKNLKSLLPEEERITNASIELNELIPNMPALREHVELKKGPVFTLEEAKLSTSDFYEELSKIPKEELDLLELLRLLIRVDITRFSDQESFTHFFLKFFNPSGKKKLKAYFEQEAIPQGKGGGKKSLRKRIKTTRRKTKTKTKPNETTSITSSARSQVRTSRKAHSK